MDFNSLFTITLPSSKQSKWNVVNKNAYYDNNIKKLILELGIDFGSDTIYKITSGVWGRFYTGSSYVEYSTCFSSDVSESIKKVKISLPLTTSDIGKNISLRSRTASNTTYSADNGCSISPYYSSSESYSSINVKLNTKVTSEFFNSQPTINGKTGENISLGEKNSPFTISYTVEDDDINDVLTVKEYLDGTLLKTRSNATRGFEYNLEITKEQLYNLEQTGKHTVSISVSDGNGAETTNNYNFVRVNLVPVLTVTSAFDETTVFKESSPSITYTVEDPEGEEVKVGILVDGIVVQPLEVVDQSQENTIEIEHDNWITVLNGKHTLTLQAQDIQGGISTKEYTFIKNEDTIEVQLKEPIKTGSTYAQGVYLSIIKHNVNNDSVKVMVTNNGLDTSPTWEDATSEVVNMNKYTFTNTSKTASEYALDVKITATRTVEVGTIKILGEGGSII